MDFGVADRPSAPVTRIVALRASFGGARLARSPQCFQLLEFATRVLLVTRGHSVAESFAGGGVVSRRAGRLPSKRSRSAKSDGSMKSANARTRAVDSRSSCTRSQRLLGVPAVTSKSRSSADSRSPTNVGSTARV